MPRSPERVAAQRKLQEAIEEQIAQYRADNVARGQDEDKGMVTDWVLVVHTMSYDGEGDELSGYYMSYANGQMPDHRAIGLLTHGVYMIQNGDMPDDEDD